MLETVKIYTAEDLRLFRDRVNSGETDLNGILMKDVNIAEIDEKENPVSWVPIGAGSIYNNVSQFNQENPYKGVFDGNGFTVYGLYINKARITEMSDKARHKAKIIELSDKERPVAGFFGESKGTIKNVSVSGIIKSNLGYAVGGICGENYSGGIIENCVNKCAIYGNFFTGGIVGVNHCASRIKNCINEGKITGPGDCITGIYGGDWCDESEVEEKDKQLDENKLVTECTNKGIICVTKEIQPYDTLAANNFKFNQIANLSYLDSSNRQNGKVIFPFQNTLSGMFLRYYTLFDPFEPDDAVEQVMRRLLQKDPNTEYVNERGETYLHLLCQNPGLQPETFINRICPNPRLQAEAVIKTIKILAVETRIDFKAKDMYGKTASDYVKDPEIKKLIRVIVQEQKNKRFADNDTSFSTIGF